MKIALGADSAGKPLLDVIEAHLKSKPEHSIANLSQSGFYADLSASLAHKVKDGEFDRGILVCCTGIGVCISANKVPGIRAALTHDTYSAERAAKSNNAQIITMGARVIGIAGSAEKCAHVVEVLGFDGCVNRSDAEWKQKLATLCPDGINAYFDTVGGEMLEGVLPRLAMNGRGRVEPNPMVGCVIVKHGQVIGEGFHDAWATGRRWTTA
jgi:ribose 5-phosphate isomerase B